MSGGQVLTGPHFITTRATTVGCRHCGRPKLEATVGGIDRHIDPAPLTPAGELAALLDGRPTYNLAGPLSDHLIQRTVHHIRGGDRSLPVVAEHTCQPPQPGHVATEHVAGAAALIRRLAAPGAAGGLPDRPPF